MADPTPGAETKTPPIRALVINLMFSMFVSLVVFAIASYLFLVPQITVHQGDLMHAFNRIDALERAAAAAASAEEAVAEEGGAPTDGAAEEGGAPTDGAAAAAPADGAAPVAEPAKAVAAETK
jgi:predicted lipid-binding transport protein (Tim44 family)